MKSFTNKRSITKIIRLLLVGTSLFVLQTQLNAQNDSLRQHYLQKSRNTATGGWVMLGASAACFIIYAVENSNPVEMAVRAANDQDVNKGSGFIVAATLFVAASIPLFIAAGKNKRKAAAISVSSTGWQKLQGNSIATSYQPCLKQTVPL